MQQLHERDAQLSNVGRPLSDAEYDHFKSGRRRSVCIRNLPFHYTDRELFSLVINLLGCKSSDIEACRVKYCRDHGIDKPMHLGYVMLRSIAMAKEVIALLQRFPRHDGRDLRAEIFRDRVALTHSRDGAVYYRFDANGYEPLITEELIRSHLESSPAFGLLTSLCIKSHHWNRKRRGQSGFGFLTFANDELNQMVKRGHDLSTVIDFVQYSFSQTRNEVGEGAAVAPAQPSSSPSSLRQSMPYRPPMMMSQPYATAAAVAPTAVAAAAAPTHNAPAPPMLLPTYLVTSPLQFATPVQPYPPPPTALYMQLPANDHGPSPWTWLAHSPSNGGGHHSRPAAVMSHEAARSTSARRFALVRVIDEEDGSLSFLSGPGSVIPLATAPNGGFVLPLPPPPGALPPPFPPMGNTMTSYSSDTSHSSSAPSSPHHIPPVMVKQPPCGVGYARSSLGHHMTMSPPTGGHPLTSLPPRDSSQQCGSPSVDVERSTGAQCQMTEPTGRGPM